MELKDALKNIRDAHIEFATMRPAGSKLTTLDRRIVITSPSQLVELSRTGDLAILDALVELLKDKASAWTAAVLLAAMTGREEKSVEVFATDPGEWWEAFGKTAFERWSKWLEENRGKLVWDPENHMFVERD
jgi:hypothetical protein